MVKSSGEIPQTYDELIVLLESVKDESDGSFLFACKDSWTLGQMLDRRLGQLFINTGADFDQTFKDIGAGSLNAGDVPEIRQASEKILQLFEYGMDPFPNPMQYIIYFMISLAPQQSWS